MATKSKEVKKKGLFSFLYEDGAEKVEEVVAEEETTEKPAVAKSIVPQPTITNTTEVDAEILEQLSQVLEENNLDGYDYFEFRGSLENMKNVIPGEAERFKGAFAAVASFVTVERLLETADYYLGKLGEKDGEFTSYVEGTFAEKVTAKETEAENIDKAVLEKNDQISLLNKEINELQEAKTAALNESITEKSKIEKVQVNFGTALKKITEGITADKKKIETYLTTTPEAKAKEGVK